jgi:hypothetical protein|tara:strand:+ start:44876 stop:45502 length:627 start_codon:yes stop_codon:yes gene_type:complete
MSIKITNLTTNKNSLQISLGSGVADRTVRLGRSEMVWSPNSRITNSLSIYQRKGLISIKTEEKPEHLLYYIPYNKGMIPAPPVAETPEQPIKIHVQNVGGDIGITSEALGDALKESDERGNKGEISPEDFKEIIDEQNKRNTILDSAKNMIDKYKGMNTGRWDDDEEKLLRKTYPKEGLKKTVEVLNRSESSVKKKVESLGLKKKKKK